MGKADGIAVNAGTGASVTGRRGERIEKAGGWGHILGDAGGGYFLSLQALRFILREYDLHRGEAQFTASILRALALNSRDDLVRWAQTADKLEVASLAPVVFEAATNGDEHVMKIVEDGAGVLSEYTAAVATRLGLLAPKVILLGGLFQRDGVYVHAFKRKLKKNLSDARVAMSEQSPELGAAWLAAEMEEKPVFSVETRGAEVENLARALTEQRNPRSEKLEELSAQELVELFVEEEKFVQEALRKGDGVAGPRDRDGGESFAQRGPPVLRRCGDERTAGGARCQRDSADFRRFAGNWCRESWRAERAPCIAASRAPRTNRAAARSRSMSEV